MLFAHRAILKPRPPLGRNKRRSICKKKDFLRYTANPCSGRILYIDRPADVRNTMTQTAAAVAKRKRRSPADEISVDEVVVRFIVCRSRVSSDERGGARREEGMEGGRREANTPLAPAPASSCVRRRRRFGRRFDQENPGFDGIGGLTTGTHCHVIAGHVDSSDASSVCLFNKYSGASLTRWYELSVDSGRFPRFLHRNTKCALKISHCKSDVGRLYFAHSLSTAQSLKRPVRSEGLLQKQMNLIFYESSVEFWSKFLKISKKFSEFPKKLFRSLFTERRSVRNRFDLCIEF